MWAKHAAAGGEPQPPHVQSALADAECCSSGNAERCAEVRGDINMVHAEWKTGLLVCCVQREQDLALAGNEEVGNCWITNVFGQ